MSKSRIFPSPENLALFMDTNLGFVTLMGMLKIPSIIADIDAALGITRPTPTELEADPTKLESYMLQQLDYIYDHHWATLTKKQQTDLNRLSEAAQKCYTSK